MENQYKSSLQDNINSIYELLYLPSLDNTMQELLSFYIRAYNQTLDEYNISPSEEIRKRLELMSGPINYVFKNFPDDDAQTPYPAVEIIKKNFGFQSVSQDKDFTRSLKSPTPNILPDEPNDYQINGFSFGIIIIIATIILGIGLAFLLLFIK